MRVRQITLLPKHGHYEARDVHTDELVMTGDTYYELLIELLTGDAIYNIVPPTQLTLDPDDPTNKP